MRTRIGLTFLMMTLFASEALADVEAFPEIDEERYQLPPDEELLPAPSLAQEEREDLYEYLDMLGERHGYYSLRRKENYRKHFDLENIADWVKLRQRWFTAGGVPPSAQEKRDEVQHPLRDMHDPWLFEVAFGAFDEEPVDWEIVWRALRILRAVDPHPELVNPDPDTERLVRKIFRQPVTHPLPKGQNAALRKSLSRIRQWWPEEPWPEYAAEKWETALTLPEQPSDRDILPLAEGESREAEAEVAEAAASTFSAFHARRERGTEVIERVQMGADEGRYTITPRLAEVIEGVEEAWARQDELERRGHHMIP